MAQELPTHPFITLLQKLEKAGTRTVPRNHSFNQGSATKPKIGRAAEIIRGNAPPLSTAFPRDLGTVEKAIQCVIKGTVIPTQQQLEALAGAYLLLPNDWNGEMLREHARVIELYDDTITSKSRFMELGEAYIALYTTVASEDAAFQNTSNSVQPRPEALWLEKMQQNHPLSEVAFAILKNHSRLEHRGGGAHTSYMPSNSPISMPAMLKDPEKLLQFQRRSQLTDQQVIGDLCRQETLIDFNPTEKRLLLRALATSQHYTTDEPNNEDKRIIALAQNLPNFCPKGNITQQYSRRLNQRKRSQTLRTIAQDIANSDVLHTPFTSSAVCTHQMGIHLECLIAAAGGRTQIPLDSPQSVLLDSILNQSIWKHYTPAMEEAIYQLLDKILDAAKVTDKDEREAVFTLQKVIQDECRSTTDTPRNYYLEGGKLTAEKMQRRHIPEARR